MPDRVAWVVPRSGITRDPWMRGSKVAAPCAARIETGLSKGVAKW
jgi:hypothetical protein